MERRRPKACPVAVTNAAVRIGVKVMPWIPPWLKRLLAGGSRIVIDGNTLDATLQLMLTAQRLTRTGGLSAADDPRIARSLMRSSHAVMGTNVAVPTVDLTITGPDGPLRARHYRTPDAAVAPLLVFFHGGGFVVGDIESHGGLCRMISDGFFLSEQVRDWFTTLYLDGTEIAADDPRVSPLQATDLSGLAPALVLTAGFDPLRDEGNEHAAALSRAGVAVDHRQFDALTHGFASIAPFGGESADAVVATVSAIRAHLTRAGQP
jgi:acetyl esterase/lipase